MQQLQAALAEVKVLQEILPLCRYCKKIRDDEDYWHTVEGYVAHRTNRRFSHSICPACFPTVVVAQLGDGAGVERAVGSTAAPGYAFGRVPSGVIVSTA